MPSHKNNYVEYQFNDTEYFGAKKIVEAERQAIKARRGSDHEPRNGLALSGGGIRSASFALGVMQALSYKGWLKKIDYLSTVSGGGYIGCCLSYLLHKDWQAPPPSTPTELIKFGLSWDTFPLGTYPMVDPQGSASPEGTYHRARGKLLRHLRQNAKYLEPTKNLDLLSLIGVLLRNALVSFVFFLGLVVLLYGLLGQLELLRSVNTQLNMHEWWNQGAIEYASLTAWVFLMLASVGGLFAGSCGKKRCFLTVLVGLISLAIVTGYGIPSLCWVTVAWEKVPKVHPDLDWLFKDNLPLHLVAILLGFFVLFGVLSSVSTWLFGRLIGGALPNRKGWIPGGFLILIIFLGVLVFLGWQKTLLLNTVILVVLAFVVYILCVCISKMFDWFKPYALRRRLEQSYHYLILSAGLVTVVGVVPYIYDAMNKATESLFVPTVAGVVLAIFVFFQTGKTKKPWIPTVVLVVVGVAALLVGFLVLGFWFARPWLSPNPTAGWPEWTRLFVLVLGLGWFVNLNYLSVHRYYRDRLMETFMPDVDEVLKEGTEMRTTVGNTTMLKFLWGGNEDAWPKKRAKTHDDGCLGRYHGVPPVPWDAPYHIINANVILVSSAISKFRGRGGDNFILTPLYCGSNATGWAATDSVLYEGLTLASAMAVSGAAVNPNAACGGEGITRNRMLSLLMGLLNLRLGYWIPNPRWLTHKQECSPPNASPKRVGNVFTRALLGLSAFGSDETPNFLYPGLGEVILRRNLDEESGWLELSDGGHFENLALYELVRRKLRLIIVCDGAADPKYQFADLANAIEKVRADFGALISFDPPGIESLIPVSDRDSSAREPEGGDPIKYAERGYLVGRIRYPDNTEGTLIYIPTTFFRGLSDDLFGYQRTHPEFPEEPTTNQFFDEKQFEAYRELGYQTAYRMLCDDPYVRNLL